MARRRALDLYELQRYAGGDIILLLPEWQEEDLSNIRKFQVAIQGPAGTPYEKAPYILDVKVSFVTKVFHPNISARGLICLDILQSEWKPGMTLLEVCEAVRALLSLPNWVSSLNIAVSAMRGASASLYYETAIMWSRAFANSQLEGPQDRTDALQTVVTNLGIEERALTMLTQNMWNVQALLN